MVKSVPAQESFNGGEWSPHLWGRQSGVESYENSCREVTNYLPLVQGPAVFRAGFKYLHRQSDLSQSILIRFEVSSEQAYFVEFGNLKCRFFTTEGVVTEAAKTITAITQDNPAVFTSAAHGFDDGDEVFVSGVVGMGDVNNRFYTVDNKTTDTFELVDDDGNVLDSSLFAAYVSGGSVARVFVLTSPYSSSQVFDIYYTQSADTLYLVHPNHKPKTLVRVSPSEFKFEDLVLTDGPYLDVNTTTTTLTPSGTSGTITLTASATTGINGGDGFLTTDIGRLIRIRAATGNWAWGAITARTSATQVTVALTGTLGGTGATAIWRFGVFSETTGWPEVVTFFQDRLTFIEAQGDLQGAWFSRRGNYVNFSPTEPNGDVFADNAITLFLNSNTNNRALWALPIGRKLVVGTASGEWTIGASTSGEALTAATAVAEESTTFGSKKVLAIKVNNTALFVGATERSIGQIKYSFESDNYEANDMNLFADHIMRGGVAQIAYSRDPENRLFVAMKNGDFLTMAYKPDQNVTGWARMETNGAVKSCASIPRGAGKNAIGIIVHREIGRKVYKFVEVKDDEVDVFETVENAKYLDCSARYDGRSRPVASLALSETVGDSVVTASDAVFNNLNIGDFIRCGVCAFNSPVAEIIEINSATEIVVRVLSDFEFKLSYVSGDWELLRRRDFLTGLWHLEGQTVSVCADGATHPDVVVQNGRIELNDKYFVVHVGLEYKGRLVTKMFSTGSSLGSAQGRIKRINRVVIQILNTLGLSVGVTNYIMDDNTQIDDMDFRASNDRMDLTTGGLSGFFQYGLPVSNQREGSIVIEQNAPLPQTIISVMPQMDTYEE